jgi:hypothetical protein
VTALEDSGLVNITVTRHTYIHTYIHTHKHTHTHTHSLTQVTALENSGIVNITVTRHTNIIGSCSCAYEVRTGTGTTAVNGTNFGSASGTLVFNSVQTSRTIQVSVYSIEGYSAADVSFIVQLSSAVNASVGSKSTTVVSLRNVHPPAPSIPTQTAATASQVSVSWSAPEWPNAPEGAAAQVCIVCVCAHMYAVPVYTHMYAVPVCMCRGVLMSGYMHACMHMCN